METGHKFGTSILYEATPDFRAVRDEIFKLNSSNSNEDDFLSELETLFHIKITGLIVPASQRPVLAKIISNWIKMFLWVAQKNTKLPKQKHPFDTTDFRGTEQAGIYLNSILSLCKTILDYADDFEYKIPEKSENAFGWWRHICIELESCQLKNFFHLPEDTMPQLTIAPFNGLSSKAKIDRGVREELAALNEGINPYPDLVNSENFYNLISACLYFDKNSNFIKNDVARREFNFAWSNYKDEYRKFGEKIRKSSHAKILRRKGDKVYRQLKREPGQPAVEVLYPEPTPPSFKIPRSKRTPPKT
jgi:hypothetical protein